MSLDIGWHEIALRLALTFGAAFLIGMNRDKKGEAAGLRTTLLVCLAASVSMIQVNLLLGINGKNSGSFAVMDLMRLPLGILTGMGFIGGGAILKRGNMVLGVTTAASLWFTTVIGLCFGGGQIGLGLVSVALALLVLTALKKLEGRNRQEHRGILRVCAATDGISRERIREMIVDGHADALACSVTFQPAEKACSFEFIVASHKPLDGGEPPAFVGRLCRDKALREVSWIPEMMGGSPPDPSQE